MGLVEAVKTCFRKYATFSGRASRSEFWYWWLFTTLVSTALEFLAGIVSPVPLLGLLFIAAALIFSLAILVPSVAVASRRLHDIGRSGWWQLLGLGTVVLAVGADGLGLPTLLCVLLMLSGLVVLFVWSVRCGTAGDNRFGPDPLAQPAPADAAFAEG